jgi:hypothetical protein
MADENSPIKFELTKRKRASTPPSFEKLAVCPIDRRFGSVRRYWKMEFAEI